MLSDFGEGRIGPKRSNEWTQPEATMNRKSFLKLILSRFRNSNWLQHCGFSSIKRDLWDIVRELRIRGCMEWLLTQRHILKMVQVNVFVDPRKRNAAQAAASAEIGRRVLIYALFKMNLVFFDNEGIQFFPVLALHMNRLRQRSYLHDCI